MSSKQRKIGFGKILQMWWKRQQKLDEGDHEKMPCWRQYFTIFVGSICVGVLTVTVTSLFAVIDPLVQYFVLFSVLHLNAVNIHTPSGTPCALKVPTQAVRALSRPARRRRYRQICALFGGRSLL